MKHLAHFLEETLKKRGMYTEAKASYVLEKMRQILDQNLGEESQKFLTVQKFSEKTLFIQCQSSSWRHVFSQHKKSFLHILQAEFSEEEIKNIVLK